MLHAWVTYRRSTSLTAPHWIELRWVGNHFIHRFLRAQGPDTTRLILDAVKQEGDAPFIADPPEMPAAGQLLVIPPGYEGYVFRPQTPVGMGIYPNQDELDVTARLVLAYTRFSAEQVTGAFESLRIFQSN